MSDRRLIVEHRFGSSDEIQHMLTQLLQQGERMATDITSVKALVIAMKDATDGLAARVAKATADQAAAIASLKKQIADGSPVTQADLDGLAVDLTAEVSALTAIGADSANPIP